MLKLEGKVNLIRVSFLKEENSTLVKIAKAQEEERPSITIRVSFPDNGILEEEEKEEIRKTLEDLEDEINGVLQGGGGQPETGETCEEPEDKRPFGEKIAERVLDEMVEWKHTYLPFQDKAGENSEESTKRKIAENFIKHLDDSIKKLKEKIISCELSLIDIIDDAYNSWEVDTKKGGGEGDYGCVNPDVVKYKFRIKLDEMAKEQRVIEVEVMGIKITLEGNFGYFYKETREEMGLGSLDKLFVHLKSLGKPTECPKLPPKELPKKPPIKESLGD